MRTYYGLCGSGISKTVGTIVELLSASAHEPISDRELRMLSDVSKALPDASEALFSFLAKRADGGTVCLSVDVPTDAQIFLPYVRKILVPTFRPGDIVIMDNPASPNGLGVEMAISSAGAHVEHLSPYSLDFNPIEKVWSNIEANLRAAEARTSRSLHTAISKAFEAVTPGDAKSWFASCDYKINYNALMP